MNSQKRRVVVAMSGGVDSSVAAYLLKEQGYEVTGLFMSLGTCLEKSAPRKRACCSIFDAKDAQSVAEKFGIEFFVLDFKAEFEKLIDYFCREYDAGRTPNPCIRCNQDLKFGRLLDYAKKIGADAIATGHYARVSQADDRYILKKGLDGTKDQSYVLFSLTQSQLSRINFPLGEFTKSQVRDLAKKINIPVQNKLDSQEICFVPDNNYGQVLKKRFPDRIKEGEIKDFRGQVLGRHPGYQLFTIGQRHGLKIALGKPAYVIRIVPETNTVIIGSKEDLARKSLMAAQVNWISIPGLAAGETLKVEAKIRYQHKPARAWVSAVEGADKVRVEFEESQFAVTPGQAVVFYQGDLVVGGGWIT